MPRWVRVDLNYAQICKTHRRQRYVPINERIADYCYDFIADERLNAGNYGRNPLPEDANEIYEARGCFIRLFYKRCIHFFQLRPKLLSAKVYWSFGRKTNTIVFTFYHL